VQILSNFGAKSNIFGPNDLEIRPMTFKTIGTFLTVEAWNKVT